jgi:hypothetical protein
MRLRVCEVGNFLVCSKKWTYKPSFHKYTTGALAVASRR